jgi:putative ABC transport system permease protein
MLRRTLEISGSSFKMAMQELWKNKLRTFLSLSGIAFGIFCIIGVLATVQSLEQNIQNEIKSLGANTIYIDKWEYGAGSGGEYPYWKFVNRPPPLYSEMGEIKKRTTSAKHAAFRIKTNGSVEYKTNIVSNVNLNGISSEFNNIQPVDLAAGRNISPAEFDAGRPVMIIGHEVAEKLFSNNIAAVGKIVFCRGKNILIAGVIKKQGRQLIGGWDFDNSIMLPYMFARKIMNERRTDPVIMVQGHSGISSTALKDELAGTMRSVHRLGPRQEDNFSLNDVNDFSAVVSDIFSGVNLGGWAIAALSLIVGMFGVANIMFVSVKERTNQIGIKKAVGAKRRIIMTEFLMESAFLCITGGLIGLTLVFLLAQVLTQLLNFPVFVSGGYMALAIFICIITGVLAGFFPALQAAKMNPVVAIRSK